MNIYYIDYENVSSQGLKGIELLTQEDEVVLLYSKKADHVKIDMLTMMMESKARIRFLPVHVGTPNALDFQLVTLLFLNYKPENFCYIISKDSGYDCCIKTAAENGAENVARYPNIESAVNKTPMKKTRRGKQTVSETAQPASEPAPMIIHSPVSDRNAESSEAPSDTAAQPEEETAKKKPSRRRSRKKAPVQEADTAQQAVQSGSAGNETVTREAPESVSAKPVDQTAERAEDHKAEKASGQEKDRKADKVPGQEKDRKADKAPGQGNEKPVEHVLQQRYLSKQFEAKNPPSSSAAKSDADKPVSILSVIRRRNDVQLDMHQIDLIRDALKNSSNKQHFYSYFVKKLGQKQGIELYHSIKSSYTDLVNANLI